MKTRLRAIKGLTYPVGDSLRVVRRAGGLRKLTPEQRAKLKLKHVKPGDFCDDVPPASRPAWIAAGKIEHVPAKKGKAK